MVMQSGPWNNNCAPGPLFNRLPEVGCLPPTSPISVSTYVTTGGGGWAHTVPSPMPWGGSPPHFTTAPQDQQGRSTFQDHPCTSTTPTSWELMQQQQQGRSASLHLKRKGGDVTEGPGPLKQCITEERMAARFQDMHITNRFTLPPHNNTEQTTHDAVNNLQQLDCILKDGSSKKSLVLAPELKKLVEPEKIFASTFLAKVERPSMALVLWQPQKGLTEETKKEEEESQVFLPSHFNALCSQHLLSNLQAKNDKTTPLSNESFDVEMDGETT